MRKAWSRVQWWLAAGSVVVAACSSGTKTETPTTTKDAGNGADAADDTTGNVTDTGSGTDDTGSAVDAGSDTKVDSGPADTAAPTGCLSDAQCVGKVPSMKASCEIESCVKETGLCVAVPKPGYCCESAECDDGVACTNDVCDPDSHK